MDPLYALSTSFTDSNDLFTIDQQIAVDVTAAQEEVLSELHQTNRTITSLCKNITRATLADLISCQSASHQATLLTKKLESVFDKTKEDLSPKRMIHIPLYLYRQMYSSIFMSKLKEIQTAIRNIQV